PPLSADGVQSALDATTGFGAQAAGCEKIEQRAKEPHGASTLRHSRIGSSSPTKLNAAWEPDNVQWNSSTDSGATDRPRASESAGWHFRNNDRGFSQPTSSARCSRTDCSDDPAGRGINSIA